MSRVEDRQFTFPKNAKVQLKHDFGDIYSQTWGGALGYVRDMKFDDAGFEKVYIVWEGPEADWRYNGQNPGWTFANHFTLKELPGPTPKPPRKKKITVQDPELEAYMEELQKGMEALAGSEGFALFVAKRVPVPDNPSHNMIVPEVYAAAHSSEADAMLGITMSEHLQETFQDLTMMMLEIYSDEDGDEENPNL